MNITYILERALSLYEDKEAVVCGEKRFTYSRFAERVYGLANFLKRMGIGKDHCVAVLHHNSHEYLECYFAAAQLGAILNPLNFRLSPGELNFILEDSGARLLIAARRFGQNVSSVTEMAGNLDQVVLTGSDDHPPIPGSLDYEEVLDKEKTTPPQVPEISDDDVAHLYYTSGTTGRPKGVMLSHKNVCSHAVAAIAELHLTDQDNWIHV
ncbi:MAG: AMP-binding protein, partial [Desulfobacteraceae bacterium]|nr:AMP-binding protein [Desulfobacteraceae bacterium]